MSGETALDGQRSLYILSPGDRDGLSQLAQSAGWRVIAARRATDAAQRFLHSDARIALTDMRGARDGDLRLIASLVPAVDAGGGALVVLVDAHDLPAVPGMLEAGATTGLSAAPPTAGGRNASGAATPCSGNGMGTGSALATISPAILASRGRASIRRALSGACPGRNAGP